MTTIKLPKLNDMQVHFRQGLNLADIVPWTSRCCAHALVMPNTDPPVRNGEDVQEYRTEIEKNSRHQGFKPLMTIKLLPETSYQDIVTAKLAGAVAVKLYIAGTTTNSQDGIPASWIENFDSKLEHMHRAIAEEGLVYCIHGEMPKSCVLDREADFIQTNYIHKLLERYPSMKIVLEHITTTRAVRFIRHHFSQALESKKPIRLAGTITLHHLMMTIDDVIGDKLQPHNFCKPIAKRLEDQNDLIRAACSNDPCFFLGSDSAPHGQWEKECAESCAGCFTAPLLPELLLAFFSEHNMAELGMTDFASRFGAEFYGLPWNADKVLTFVQEPWAAYKNIGMRGPIFIPWHAGRVVPWKQV